MVDDRDRYRLRDLIEDPVAVNVIDEPEDYQEVSRLPPPKVDDSIGGCTTDGWAFSSSPC
jgi:hypothetical protein